MELTREEKAREVKGFFNSNNNFDNVSDKELSEFYQFVKFMRRK